MKILASLLIVTASSVAFATDRVPVTVGQAGPEIDACPSLAEIKTRAVVRSMPATTSATVTELNQGSVVHVCGHTKDGKWSSVVFALQAGLDCKVSSPVARPQFYRGPCKSGWTPTKSLKIVAG